LPINNSCPFDITPYTESELIITPQIFNLNYTNQDFWSMKTRLIEYIRQKFDKEFSDFVESSLAVMLIENWAFLADTLSFKMDQIANEIFIDTVTEPENAFRLAKLVGFEPQPPIAARSLWTASLNNVLTTDVEIPTPFEVNVSSGNQTITIELFPADSENNPIFDQNIVIPASNVVNASIIGLEGRTKTTQTSGTGAVGQTISLLQSPVIYDSVQVYVDGVKWQKVDFFTDSQPRREFRVEFDSSYNAYVIFGNNRAGLIPSTGSQIVVTHRQGGGTIGNIVSGAVEKQTVVVVPGFSFTVPVIVRNYTKGEFGYDGDTIEDLRNKLPAWIRTQNRAVTGLDYKTLIDQFSTPYQGQVGKSLAILRNYGCSGNIIDVYVLAKEGIDGLAVCSDELKVSIQNFIETKKMITDFVCLRDGEVINVDMSLDVSLDRIYKKFEDEIRTKIQRRLDNFFSLNNWEFGEDLKEADLLKSLNDIKEINSLNATFSTNDPDNGGDVVTTKFYQIIRPEDLVVNFSYE
jgi:hypothetical protein